MTATPDLHSAIHCALPDPEALTGTALAAAADVARRFPGVPVDEVRRVTCLLAVGSAEGRAEELDEEAGIEPPGATSSENYNVLVAVAEDATAEAREIWAGQATG